MKNKTERFIEKTMDSQMKRKDVIAFIHMIESVNLTDQRQAMEDAGFAPNDPRIKAVGMSLSRTGDRVRALMAQGVDLGRVNNMLHGLSDKVLRKVRKKIKKAGKNRESRELSLKNNEEFYFFLCESIEPLLFTSNSRIKNQEKHIKKREKTKKTLAPKTQND